MEPRSDRRRVLTAALAGAALGGLPWPIRAVGPGPARATTRLDPAFPEDPFAIFEAGMAFEVRRGGSRIGRHRLAFARPGPGRLDVAIDIDLEVTFGPFTLYRYTHRNRTRWADGRVLSLATETDDDGEAHRVRAERGPGGQLRVTADGTTGTLPAEVLPTSYWMTATIDQSRLLNTQTGALAEVSVQGLGTRAQAVPEGEATARGYRMTGDVEADIWYDATGRWVGLSFDGKGERITYRLNGRRGDLPTAPPGRDDRRS